MTSSEAEIGHVLCAEIFLSMVRNATARYRLKCVHVAYMVDNGHFKEKGPGNRCRALSTSELLVFSGRQLAQHVLKDTAIEEILQFIGGIDAAKRFERGS